MISVRASKVPLLLTCGQSHADVPLHVESDNQEARLGTAGHDGAAQFDMTGAHGSAADLAEKYGVDDVDELGMMLSFARQAVTALKPHFPNPIIEQSFAIQLSETVELTGHADKISIGDEHVAIADYKSGRKRRDYIKQLQSYAILATDVFDKPQWSVTVVWLRDHETVTRSGTREQLEAVKGEIVAAAEGANTAPYVVGEACEYCPRFTDCPARSALLKQSAQDLNGITAESFAELGPNLFSLYSGIKFIEKACQDFRNLLRGEIYRTGPMVFPGVGRAEFKEIKKRILKPIKAWSILSSHLTEEELESVMSISIGAAEDIVAKKAGRGMGVKAKKALEAALDAAGAIERKTEKRISVTEET